MGQGRQDLSDARRALRRRAVAPPQRFQMKSQP